MLFRSKSNRESRPRDLHLLRTGTLSTATLIPPNQTLLRLGGRMVPAWLDVDQENLRGTVKEMPTRDEIDVPVNEMLIVELYSK